MRQVRWPSSSAAPEPVPETVVAVPAPLLARFELLAQSVAGRHVAVLADPGELRAYTDGTAIHVPTTLAPELIPCVIVAHAALIRAGSLRSATMLALVSRPAMRLRYLTLETVRAVTALPECIPLPIAHVLKAVYDGPVTEDPEDSLRRATGARRRAVPEAPEWLGTVKPLVVLRKRGRASDSVGAAHSGVLPPSLALPQTPAREADEDAERSVILEMLAALPGTALSALTQRLARIGPDPGDEATSGVEMAVDANRSGPVTGDARAIASRPVRVAPAPPRGFRYPEWDWAQGRYRLDWCTVTELDPAESSEPTAPPQDLDDPGLRRELAKIGRRYERRRRQLSGDDLDFDSLVDAMVDLAAGHADDLRVYEDRSRTAADLGVLVLLDVTGSTEESRDGRRIFDEQRHLAARLSFVLGQLDARVAVFGFYSRGREAVRFLRVKDFDDRLDAAALDRLTALIPGGYTRLGAAIRHGGHLLSERAGTTQRLLVVIGDGQPYEEGYEHRYAYEDSRRALNESVSAGVGCVCLSVRASTDPTVLEQVWGDVPHIRLADPSDLSRNARTLFSDALAAAAAAKPAA